MVPDDTGGAPGGGQAQDAGARVSDADSGRGTLPYAVPGRGPDPARVRRFRLTGVEGPAARSAS